MCFFYNDENIELKDLNEIACRSDFLISFCEIRIACGYTFSSSFFWILFENELMIAQIVFTCFVIFWLL